MARSSPHPASPIFAAATLLGLSSGYYSWPSTHIFVAADKDSDYYRPGESNPLVKEKMYWKDSINVLEDLSKFKALYVRYHNCVWSTYGSRYGNGYEEGSQSDDEGYDNGCVGGGYGGENFWYLGRTQCFRANAAFSLYGVLLDDGDSEAGDDGTYCHKGTYINSFFSTNGVESFAGPLGISTCDVNSYCTSSEPDNNAYMYDYDAGDDDFTPYNYKAWTSYGIGCLDGRFVQDKYQGAFCHGSNFITTMDTLDSYNSGIESMQCAQIYSYDSGQYEYDNQQNDQEQEDEQEDDSNEESNDGNMDFANKDPLTVLSYSKSCSLFQYPNDCPDPYGKKRHYTSVWERYLTALGVGAPGSLEGSIEAATGTEKVIWTCAAFVLVAGLSLMCFAHRVQQINRLEPSSLLLTSPDKKRGWFTFTFAGSDKASSMPEMEKKGLTPSVERTRSAPASAQGGVWHLGAALSRNAALAFVGKEKQGPDEATGAYAQTDKYGVPSAPSSSSDGSSPSGDADKVADTPGIDLAPSAAQSIRESISRQFSHAAETLYQLSTAWSSNNFDASPPDAPFRDATEADDNDILYTQTEDLGLPRDQSYDSYSSRVTGANMTAVSAPGEIVSPLKSSSKASSAGTDDTSSSSSSVGSFNDKAGKIEDDKAEKDKAEEPFQDNDACPNVMVAESTNLVSKKVTAPTTTATEKQSMRKKKKKKGGLRKLRKIVC